MWMYVLLRARRLVGPVGWLLAARRDAWRAADVGGALRQSIEIVDRQIGQHQWGGIHSVGRRVGAHIAVAGFVGAL